MEISKVVFNNFRPYFGSNEIDLSVNPEQNIILVGGRNGQGKTSFLVGLVWGIYGKAISSIDKTFSREVKNNYPKFLESCLNRNAQENGIKEFGISVEFSNVELSDSFKISEQQKTTISISRTYDCNTLVEKLDIKIDGEENQLISDEEAKISFINDYLIPVEAAKFVFFDAEKISDIADLGLKEQGRVMNDALGKILGLSKYEELITDLEKYIIDLKLQHDTQTQVKRQIEASKNKITLNQNQIEVLEAQLEELENKLEDLTKKINSHELYLARKGAKGLAIDIEDIDRQKKEAENELKILGNKLHEIADIIPFAIMAGKIEEVIDHVNQEAEVQNRGSFKKEIEDKRQFFVDALFDEEPFPTEDLKSRAKAFYIEKAENIFNRLFLDESNLDDLDFFHDLSKNTKNYIQNIYNRLQNTNDPYQSVFSEYIKIENLINDLDTKLRKARASAEDEDLRQYKDELHSYQSEKDKLFIEKGRISGSKIQLEEETNKIEEQIKNQLDKLEVNKQQQEIIDEVNKHILSLKEFIDIQKYKKCNSLRDTIFTELNRIMHKKDFIDEVKVNIMPENHGLEVSLFKNGIEIPKDMLSSGEKQIYISCLLKAILKEAIVEFPIFIDTPLGRLDMLHKDNFVTEYYPFLSNQVVLLTTDEEVNAKRKEKIEDKVAQSYVLNNIQGKTTIEKGYF